MIYYDNLIFALQKAGGISTYWGELIRRLTRDGEDVVFKELTSLNNIVRKTLTINENQIIKETRLPKVLNRFCDVDTSYLSDKPFIFHSSYNRITKNSKSIQVTTIHDFVHEKFYKGVRRYLHSSQKLKNINAADQIIVVSQNTKNDLLELNPNIQSNNVHVIHNGVSEDFFVLPEVQYLEISKQHNKYILFIGSREMYKNFDFAVSVLSNLPDFHLYIVGAQPNNLEKRMLNNSLPNRWKAFINVSNEELNKMYNGAYALIYPSSYEGFGIPLLEAMKAGTPFVALNASSIPEVAGEAGILLDRLDKDSFIDAILSINLKRNQLLEKGIKQAARFSWENCYIETLALYRSLL
jgi:mannosyltransferase